MVTYMLTWNQVRWSFKGSKLIKGGQKKSIHRIRNVARPFTPVLRRKEETTPNESRSKNTRTFGALGHYALCIAETLPIQRSFLRICLYLVDEFSSQDQEGSTLLIYRQNYRTIQKTDLHQPFSVLVVYWQRQEPSIH
jgi:hypothetical protein